MKRIAITLTVVLSMVACKPDASKQKETIKDKVEHVEHDVTKKGHQVKESVDKKVEKVVEGKTAYACPMDCETGTIYDKKGACPVCKMDLVAVKTKETHDSHEGHNH